MIFFCQPQATSVFLYKVEKQYFDFKTLKIVFRDWAEKTLSGLCNQFKHSNTKYVDISQNNTAMSWHNDLLIER